MSNGRLGYFGYFIESDLTPNGRRAIVLCARTGWWNVALFSGPDAEEDARTVCATLNKYDYLLPEKWNTPHA